jgi:hypothetical protein
MHHLHDDPMLWCMKKMLYWYDVKTQDGIFVDGHFLRVRLAKPNSPRFGICAAVAVVGTVRIWLRQLSHGRRRRNKENASFCHIVPSFCHLVISFCDIIPSFCHNVYFNPVSWPFFIVFCWVVPSPREPFRYSLRTLPGPRKHTPHSLARSLHLLVSPRDPIMG